MSFIGHLIHQLRVVGRVRREKVRVDAFRLEPPYVLGGADRLNDTVWVAMAAVRADERV